ncbi:MAG: hypothetical protein J6K95_08790 [Rikenellaceae bacterium]|nr:hypothetical protein [Rikenellaceae bacterium]
MSAPERQDMVFDLVKCMSKAEKRQFKLYATRFAANSGAKFLALFDCLDSMESYDEGRILRRCPVKKEQLPNMKAHLYRQILVSIRLLDVQRSPRLQLHEHLDFAQILYDKGLYRHAARLLEKGAEQARRLELHSSCLEVLAMQADVEATSMPDDMAARSESYTRRTARLCANIGNIENLSDMVTRLCSLHQQLGYARSERDLTLIAAYFRPKLEAYARRIGSFTERYYFYQAMAWFHYIQHNFALSYRYSRKWVELFEGNPWMKEWMYADFLKGYDRILDGVFMMRKYKLLKSIVRRFEAEYPAISSFNDNASMLARRILLVARLNLCFIEGDFEGGLLPAADMEQFLLRYPAQLSLHTKMQIRYKLACIYFGAGDYVRCMQSLAWIIGTKDPMLRRDLQCYARMLNLIASYEAGVDYHIDSQIKSVFRFVVRMNDMHVVQREILAFLKKLSIAGPGGVRGELKVLYGNLKPYENHPDERRVFYYLDILSWLESKITGRTVAEVIRGNFRKMR